MIKTKTITTNKGTFKILYNDSTDIKTGNVFSDNDTPDTLLLKAADNVRDDADWEEESNNHYIPYMWLGLLVVSYEGVLIEDWTNEMFNCYYIMPRSFCDETAQIQQYIDSL